MMHALVIEALAQCRLADEYDAAQERGEIAKRALALWSRSTLGWLALERRSACKHLIDAAPIHVDDFEAPAEYLHGLSSLR
jgi:hypothetical protein